MLTEHPQGAILAVRAQAGARRNGIVGQRAGELVVSVTQAPEKGKANKALIEVLAKELSLKKSQIALVDGEASPHKRFLVAGVTVEALVERIESNTEG